MKGSGFHLLLKEKEEGREGGRKGKKKQQETGKSLHTNLPTPDIISVDLYLS